MKPETLELICKNGDNRPQFIALVELAAKGWNDIDAYLAEGYAEGLQRGGLWQCDSCAKPIEDPCHPASEYGCVTLSGDITLCHECYDAAQAARQKIVVNIFETEDGEETQEDDSALSDEEKKLARFLEGAGEHAAYESRGFISSYPRDERRDLHRYKDAIDEENSLKGKTVIRHGEES